MFTKYDIHRTHWLTWRIEMGCRLMYGIYYLMFHVRHILANVSCMAHVTWYEWYLNKCMHLLCINDTSTWTYDVCVTYTTCIKQCVTYTTCIIQYDPLISVWLSTWSFQSVAPSRSLPHPSTHTCLRTSVCTFATIYQCAFACMLISQGVKGERQTIHRRMTSIATRRLSLLPLILFLSLALSLSLSLPVSFSRSHSRALSLFLSLFLWEYRDEET